MRFRKDKDSMGEVMVPEGAYFGPQTQRSLLNFKIGSETMPEVFIKAYGMIKRAAAEANLNLGFLKEDLAGLIIKASDEVIEGKHMKEFPLKIWQTGSGTQTNMNVNEVIANIANEMAGKKRGDVEPVHPNDHVNLCQSTNDTFPTAMHVSTAILITQKLLPALRGIKKTLREKSDLYGHVIKMGRTHLQDATPITLGQEISGYEAQLDMIEHDIHNALKNIFELAIGGTAVGTGINTHKDYAEMTASLLAKKTGLPFVSAKNKFAALASHDPLSIMSGALKTLAASLLKIANDIRWMSSGPRGGLAEIFIEENEPGSSIMPGKVNPTQCEAISMVCCQVIGNDVAITTACSRGDFELNVFKPVIIKNLINSIELLSDSISCFDKKCVSTIKPNLQRLSELKDKSLMLVTCLTPHIGYDKAAMVAKKAFQENKNLKEVCIELELMREEEFDERVLPEKMLAPNRV